MLIDRRTQALALTAFLICCGCNEQPNTIVFVPSVSGADQDAVQTFVSDLSVALQEDPFCSGLELVVSDPYKDSAAIKQEAKNSHWRLFVSVIPEADTDHGRQLWSIEHDGHTGRSAWAAPKPMAHSICSIVKGTGGSVKSDD